MVIYLVQGMGRWDRLEVFSDSLLVVFFGGGWGGGVSSKHFGINYEDGFQVIQPFTWLHPFMSRHFQEKKK